MNTVGYYDLEEITQDNEAFRLKVYNSDKFQLIVQSLKPGEILEYEAHIVYQFFRCESGVGTITVENKRYLLSDGQCLIIPPGIYHKVENESNFLFNFYTIYTGRVH
jgi:mannose-6-phosphate isomerase-like protein (cupin superfamily)